MLLNQTINIVCHNLCFTKRIWVMAKPPDPTLRVQMKKDITQTSWDQG